MTPTTAATDAVCDTVPDALRSKLASPCCRTGLADDDGGLTCTRCRHRYAIESYGPDLRPAGTDAEPEFAAWRGVQSALAAWRAQTWDGSADARARSDETTRLATEFLERASLDGDVLDIGCGSGWIEPHVTSRGARYVGIDPTPCASRHTFPFARALSDRLPFATASFDGCLLFSSLDYAVDLEQTLAEIDRVLRPTGLVAVATPIHATKETSGPRLHNHRFLEGELERLFTRAIGPSIDGWWPRETYQCLWVRKRA